MKYVGFIKEHNDIIDSISFVDLLGTKINDNLLVESVSKYLENGIVVFGFMGYFDNLLTKELGEPKAYLTDGEWIWPSYFQYYLNRHPNLIIDINFINYLVDKDFQFNAKKSDLDINNLTVNLLKKIDN